MKSWSRFLPVVCAGAASFLALWSSMEFYKMVRVQNEQQPDRYRTGIQFRRFANAMRRIPEGAA